MASTCTDSIYNHRTIQILDKDPSLQVHIHLQNLLKKCSTNCIMYRSETSHIVTRDLCRHMELKGVILLIYIQQFK